MIPLAIIVEVAKDIAKYGPDGYNVAKQIVSLIRNGPHPLSPADIALLDSFDKTAADYLADAGGAPVANA